jgi:transketolase
MENNVKKSLRDGFGEALLELGKINKNVVALTANVAESTRVHWFAKKYPRRFFELGVAEQNMMGVAVGLSQAGKIPFVSAYAVFSPGRSWDQLRVSVCYSNSNVKIVGHHAGLAVGADGATHQALEDIAITRCLPNMTVIAPCDAIESARATMAATKLRGPVYLRMTRDATTILTAKKTKFQIGKINVMRAGSDVTVVGCGPILELALLAADELNKKGISVDVLNCHTIKPLDVNGLIASVSKTKAIVSVEDHQIQGGLGSAVAEALIQNCPVPMEYVGVENTFGESGTSAELWRKYGLTVEKIIEKIDLVLSRKNK